MVYQLIFKQRFQTKLEQLFTYLEKEFGLLVAQKLAGRLQQKLLNLQNNPEIGVTSFTVVGVRSIQFGKQNRIYYKIEGNKIVVLNMYDTRRTPKKNKLK